MALLKKSSKSVSKGKNNIDSLEATLESLLLDMESLKKRIWDVEKDILIESFLPFKEGDKVILKDKVGILRITEYGEGHSPTFYIHPYTKSGEESKLKRYVYSPKYIKLYEE